MTKNFKFLKYWLVLIMIDTRKFEYSNDANLEIVTTECQILFQKIKPNNCALVAQI